MKTLGFLNPKAGVGQSRLIFNLGTVLADAGFRVGLVDFDPQAALTELAGIAGEAARSVYGALAPLAEGTEPGALEPVDLGPNLWLVHGHVQVSVFDDTVATAWTPAADPLAQSLVRGVPSMLENVVEQDDLDVVLCDLGSGLGPFCHACALAVDAIVVPLAPRVSEEGALRSLASTLRRWREAPSYGRTNPFQTLGFVIVRPSGLIEVTLDRVAAAYQRELNGEHLGTIREFPSLAGIASAIHKPEIELTMADGAVGSLASAVLDLRRQYEVLATQLVRASSLLEDDQLVERLGEVLYSELDNDLPAELDSLSSHTSVQAVDDVEIHDAEVRRGGLRVTGSASVSVTLGWGGSHDGLEMTSSFPLRFDLDLDRSHEAVSEARLAVDTSSFHE